VLATVRTRKTDMAQLLAKVGQIISH